MDRGVGGNGRYGDRDRDRLSWWEDNVANVTLGTETNDCLAYDPGLERHRPIMSTLGEHGGRLEKEREKYAKFYYASYVKHVCVFLPRLYSKEVMRHQSLYKLVMSYNVDMTPSDTDVSK